MEKIVIILSTFKGKSTFLNSQERPFVIDGYEIIEQDDIVIDSGESCICKYIKMGKQHIARSTVILAMTNPECWFKNFSTVYVPEDNDSDDKYVLLNKDQWSKIIVTAISKIDKV